MKTEKAVYVQKAEKAPPDSATAKTGAGGDSLMEASTTCPNCGARLEGRKCKLLCLRPGCGYMVTCSEW